MRATRLAAAKQCRPAVVPGPVQLMDPVGHPRPQLDPKEEAEQRRRGHFADQRPSPRRRRLVRLLRVAGRGYHWARMAARLLRGERPVRVRRILVVRRGYLGDLVVFLPTLAALRARYPHAHITLGVHARFSAGALLDGSPYVDDVRVLDFLAAPTRRERLQGALRLFAAGYDLVLSGVWYFLIPEAFFTGAPLQLGLDDGHPLQAELDERVPLQPYRHEADNNLALAERLGAAPTGAARVPRLPPAGTAIAARVDALLSRLLVPEDVPFVAMHPGSKRPSRRWPAESFAALATRLLATHPALRIVLTGSADEQPLAERVRRHVPAALRGRLRSAAGQCDLAELLALLERAALLVSNDTGVMHVARARGTPLVALLGPENDLRWGPHRYGPGPAISLRCEVPCAPCPRHACPSLYCMRSVEVDEAFDAVQELLCRRTGGLPRPSAAAADDDGALVPLERRHRRRDWRALARAGFDLPLVTVLLTGGAGDDADGAMAALRLLLDRLGAQRYPRLEVVAVLPAHAADAPAQPVAVELADHGSRAERVVLVRAGGDADPMAAALRAAHGELVTPLDASGVAAVATWSPDHLGDDVAALLRLPEAALTGAPAATMRRALLEPALAALPSRGAGATRLAQARDALARRYPVATADAGTAPAPPP